VGRIADDRGCTRLAILHLDDAYGGPLAAATAADFTRRGGSVVATVPYTDGLSMYATETRMIADANPECVALIGYPRTAGNILRSYYMLTSPPTVTWIGTDGLRTDTFVTEAGTALLATVQFYGAAPITQPDGPAYEDFSQRHRALFAELPGPFVSNSYDAAALLYLGIARAQGTAGRPIMNAVRSLNTGTVVRAGELATGLAQIQREEAVNYEGASGSVDVDAYGDVRTDYEIWRVNAAGTAIDRVERVPASELD
jgi:neutral amino acid transport system substrate-binding protein